MSVTEDTLKKNWTRIDSDKLEPFLKDGRGPYQIVQPTKSERIYYFLKCESINFETSSRVKWKTEGSGRMRLPPNTGFLLKNGTHKEFPEEEENGIKTALGIVDTSNEAEGDNI